MAGAERLGRVVDRVYDLLPRALVERGDGPPKVDAAWRPQRDLWVMPRPQQADHWEAVASAEPFLALVDTPGAVLLRLVVHGTDGLRHVGRLLEAEHAERLQAFQAAAGRMDDAVTSWLAEVLGGGRSRHLPGRLGPRLRPVPGRAEATAHLGSDLVRSFVHDGLAVAARRRDPDSVAWVVADAPSDPEDAVDLRRQAKRIVALWRPLAALPPMLPPDLSKDALDRALAAAYRRSLRLLAGRVDPAERAALRTEVRRLAAAYRQRGLVRPRLLDVVTERLGIR